MFRKIFAFLTLFVFLLSIVSFSYEIEDEEFDINLVETSTNLQEIPNINSKHAIVMEKTTGTVLFEKSAYTKTPMASTTKILTAIIALENCKLTDEVEISSKAASTGGSTLGIKKNTTLSMETLLYGLLLRSGNDCAIAIAEHISGDIPSFAKLMNNKAKELGLINSHFVTPHGLDADNHFTTAYDLSILSIYALKNPTFSKIVNTKNCTINMNGYSKEIHNTHELLGFTEGVYGVKTGFTGNAGRCLVTACKRKDLDIIIVVLGADTKKIRTKDTLNLINYIYNNFEMVNTLDLLTKEFNKYKFEANINKSFEKASIALEKKDDYIFPIPKNSKNFTSSIYILENVKAPLPSNSKIGKIKLLVNGNLLYENNIITINDIPKIKFGEYINYILYKTKKLF